MRADAGACAPAGLAREEGGLTLVDGHFCLYQAFYATLDLDLRNSRNEPTGAVLIFLQKMLQLQRALSPTPEYFAVMMDSDVRLTKRREILPGYKKQRSCPPDLLAQFPKAREGCEAFGFPYKEVAGFEADDLIATYAKEASKRCPVHIISMDKDLMQLAGPKVRIHANPLNPAESLDHAGVEARFGVKPEQIGDLLALTGDSSDNIPGVPGIGPKKAAALLRRHGTLVRVLEAADAGDVRVPGVGPVLLRSLREHGGRAQRMRTVVQLQEVPGVDAATWKSFRVAPRDQRWLHSAEAFCEREDMHDFASRLRQHADGNGGARGTIGLAQLPSRLQRVVKVEDAAAAEQAMAVLEKHCRDEGRVFAMCVAATKEDPLGRAAGFSVYAGPDLDFGGSARLWVSLVEPGGGEGLLAAFREFFGEVRFRKVYHGFSAEWCSLAGHPEARPSDQPALEHGGFAGDTQHMARLLDPSLTSSAKKDGYSLEQLARRYARRFAREPLPPTSDQWAEHTAAGAVSVLHLYRSLRDQLRKQRWTLEGPQGTPPELSDLSMWDFYQRYWLPLGLLLLDMELAGVPVDRACLDGLAADARRQVCEHGDSFRRWARERVAEERGEEAAAAARLEVLNLQSGPQLVQLLFGPAEPPKTHLVLLPEGEAAADAVDAVEPSSSSSAPPAERPTAPSLNQEELEKLKVQELKALCSERQLLVSGKKADLIVRLLDPEARPVQRLSRRKVQLTIHGLGLEPPEGHVTKSQKRPQVSMQALTVLMAQRSQELRPDGIEAIGALVRCMESEALLSGFLEPLRQLSAGGRVHARLNLNTETGRLSCRRPNLQNEPLGSRLPVRKAFAAPPGQRLIVADYAQLELRLVAHLADCEPMIELLKSGGDIHSRTAYRMFGEVREAVDSGEVLLDELAAEGCEPEREQPPVVKDHFPELRKRAKTLNFALLYGKTAFGLSKDWDISTHEAQEMIDRWFDSFPEVRAWKQRAESHARDAGARTLLGRARPLRALQLQLPRREAAAVGAQNLGRALRAASNSPVQGSAADVAIAAMLRLQGSALLRDLGYRQLLQVHDELLLEGPEEHAERALAEVVRLMEDPLPFSLRVPLKVDACHVQNWHEAKL